VTSPPVQRWTGHFARSESARAGEPAWLAAARKAAIARFAELGFPDRRDEAWKYTNAARIADVPYEPAPPAPVGPEALAALRLPLAEGPHLVFANGRLVPELSAGAPDPGVTTAGLKQVLASDPDRLEPELARLSLEDRSFAVLTAALWADGALVRVPRHTALRDPLFLVFLTTGGPGPMAVHPRTVVVAEPGSRATVVEVHASLDDGASLLVPLTEIRVGENAALDHVVLGRAGAGATQLASCAVRVERSGRFASTWITAGGRLVRNDLVVELAGEGAEATLDGLYVTGDGEHVDSQTTVDHQLPHGSSRELYKGVLGGRSRAVFNGRIWVRPDAQKTDARQRNENLLMSADAEVDSKPQLEIQADDVRCSHGSTIGQLEKDALFYLRTRGIDERAARALLTLGFASQITAGIASAALRRRVEELVIERLFGAEGKLP
jgi:Fe-S cluster assembly protein SufD